MAARNYNAPRVNALREYLSKNRNATPAQVQTSLPAFTYTKQEVYNMRYMINKKQQRPKQPDPAPKSQPTGKTYTVKTMPLRVGAKRKAVQVELKLAQAADPVKFAVELPAGGVRLEVNSPKARIANLLITADGLRYIPVNSKKTKTAPPPLLTWSKVAKAQLFME